jgi:meiotically up-regulated gene 157 (Mug157) protein
MSVAEMKQKAISLIDKLDNKNKLEEVIQVLTKEQTHSFTADEVFERTAKKYDATLQKLAQ